MAHLKSQRDGTVLVPLTRGFSAMIDTEDATRVGLLSWRVYVDKRSCYALTDIVTPGKRKITVGMHRFILNPTSGMQVDHRDGDGLNNKRSNIRICSPSQNRQNLHVVRGTSGFKGVGWCRRKRRWRAQIKQDGRSFHCGYFVSELDAANAYDIAARQRFGEFARVNQIGRDARS